MDVEDFDVGFAWPQLTVGPLGEYSMRLSAGWEQNLPSMDNVWSWNTKDQMVNAPNSWHLDFSQFAGQQKNALKDRWLSRLSTIQTMTGTAEEAKHLAITRI